MDRTWPIKIFDSDTDFRVSKFTHYEYGGRYSEVFSCLCVCNITYSLSANFIVGFNCWEMLLLLTPCCLPQFNICQYITISIFCIIHWGTYQITYETYTNTSAIDVSADQYSVKSYCYITEDVRFSSVLHPHLPSFVYFIPLWWNPLLLSLHLALCSFPKILFSSSSFQLHRLVTAFIRLRNKCTLQVLWLRARPYS